MVTVWGHFTGDSTSCRCLFDLLLDSHTLSLLSLVNMLISFFLFSLAGAQFHHPHLLRRLGVWRLHCRGHLRDGLRHHLLHHLHDGAGQADPGGQLGLECESSVREEAVLPSCSVWCLVTLC